MYIHVFIEIRHNVLIQGHGNYIEEENLYYMLETDTLTLKRILVSWSDF